METTKTCGRCKEVKPHTEFYWGHSNQYWRWSSYCKQCLYETNKARRDRDPEGASARQKQHMRKHRYRLSPAEYEAHFEEQGGLCAICRRPPDGMGGLHIDHDHATDRVRGLLCMSCNMGLGQFRDSPDLLSDAMTYLHHGYVPPL